MQKKRSNTWLGLFLLLAIFTPLVSGNSITESYRESLTLRPLPSGQILSLFDFGFAIVQQEKDESSEQLTDQDELYTHFNLFPRSIGQILSTFEIEELHLSFTQGRWNYKTWGMSPMDSVSTGAGVELWAYFKNNDKVKSNWKGATNALSGLFCASLNFVDKTRTTTPKLSFQKSSLNINDNNTLQNYILKYGALPHENVCTENLTPWLKLLPCKTKSGLASLLNGHRIFDSDYHSISIHVTPIPLSKSGKGGKSGKSRGINLHLTLQTVLDVVRLGGDGKRNWSFTHMFGRSLKDICPLSQSSIIKLLTSSNDQYTLYPMEIQEMAKSHILNLHHPDIPFPFDLEMKFNEDYFEYSRLDELSNSPIYFSRTFGGYGQERGNIYVEITNNLSKSINVTYLEILPWFLKIYLHTFQMNINQVDEKPLEIYYQTGVDRSRPYVIEMLIQILPHSKTTFTIDFDKVFLRYTEYPPDANRGFDIGSSVLSFSLNGKNQRIYSLPMLVSLPTPDFSMPYNVIILTCTILALFFGSSFNRLTRRFAIMEKEKGKKDMEMTTFERIRGKIQIQNRCSVM